MPKYKLIEEGCHYTTIEADNLKKACKIAKENVYSSNYEPITETIWIEVRVKEVVDGDSDKEPEVGSVTVALDPEEPKCTNELSHEWTSPYKIVGGIEENPEVWGHGGGVIIKEVCYHCGIFRITDTWAQNKSTGEQGLRSISYEQVDDSE